MNVNENKFVFLKRTLSGALDLVEYLGLLVIGIATSIAMFNEVLLMIELHRVQLADLLLMFLYLEVLAMIGQYFKSGQLPVRFPMYIAMVATLRLVLILIIPQKIYGLGKTPILMALS